MLIAMFTPFKYNFHSRASFSGSSITALMIVTFPVSALAFAGLQIAGQITIDHLIDGTADADNRLNLQLFEEIHGPGTHSSGDHTADSMLMQKTRQNSRLMRGSIDLRFALDLPAVDFKNGITLAPPKVTGNPVTVG
jgi:hypothetical protein